MGHKLSIRQAIYFSEARELFVRAGFASQHIKAQANVACGGVISDLRQAQGSASVINH
jgi:hypothetical protein